MNKNSRQKFKYRENKRSFYDKIKAIFYRFKGFSLRQIKKFFFERRESDIQHGGKIPPTDVKIG